MCDALALIDKYLASTGNRDKVMAIVQFLPAVLAGPTQDAGCATLSKSLNSLSAMADGYRAITRLGLLAGALSQSTLTTLAKPTGDVIADRITQAGHFFHILFCLFENSAVLAGRGVYPSRLTRLGGCAVTCWFYALVLAVSKTAYTLATKPLSPAEKEALRVTLVKQVCFLIFSTTCAPAAGPQLLETASGPLVPLHNLLRLIAPRHLPLGDTARFSLALIASACDFY